MVVLDELELWQFVVLRMALGQEDDINEMEKAGLKRFFFTMLTDRGLRVTSDESFTCDLEFGRRGYSYYE